MFILILEVSNSNKGYIIGPYIKCAYLNGLPVTLQIGNTLPGGCARREISPWLSQEMRTHNLQTFHQRRSDNQGGRDNFKRGHGQNCPIIFKWPLHFEIMGRFYNVRRLSDNVFQKMAPHIFKPTISLREVITFPEFVERNFFCMHSQKKKKKKKKKMPYPT